MLRLVENIIEIAENRKITPLEFVQETFKPGLDVSTLNEDYLNKKAADIPGLAEEDKMDFY